MLNTALNILRSNREALTAEAHCDGPCGVYDPSSVRIAAEAAVSMTKKFSLTLLKQMMQQEWRLI